MSLEPVDLSVNSRSFINSFIQIINEYLMGQSLGQWSRVCIDQQPWRAQEAMLRILDFTSTMMSFTVSA